MLVLMVDALSPSFFVVFGDVLLEHDLGTPNGFDDAVEALTALKHELMPMLGEAQRLAKADILMDDRLHQCQACGRQVSGQGEDRPKVRDHPLCPTCYRDWLRSTRPKGPAFRKWAAGRRVPTPADVTV